MPLLGDLKTGGCSRPCSPQTRWTWFSNKGNRQSFSIPSEFIRLPIRSACKCWLGERETEEWGSPGGDGASCFRFPCWPDGDRSSGVPDSGQAAETCYSSGIGKVSVPSLELLSTLTTYK